MARIIAVDRFWSDPIVDNHLTSAGHDIEVVKSLEDCLSCQKGESSRERADLIIIKLPLLWGENFSVEEFLEKLRLTSSTPVVAIGVQAQAGFESHTGYKAVDLKEWRSSGLFVEVIELPLSLDDWSRLIERHTSGEAG